jgi:class 3 adenylate cyclase
VGELPTGTVTFLFTDIEGSTRLWEQHPEAMRRATAHHDTPWLAPSSSRRAVTASSGTDVSVVQ